MINFNNLSHSITAAVAAILISTTFISAAVGPGVAQAADVEVSAQATA